MDFLKQLADQILHLNIETLSKIITQLGPLTYLLLFAIIFVETGVVIMPFLPGDSLLFAAGALAAFPNSPLNVIVLLILLSIAAVAGDTVNYWIGERIGDRAAKGEIKFVKKEYIERTHAFFEKHGGKTIFLARFVPIVRTFAPFVAGAGKMSYSYFFRFNVVGGIIWVALFLFAGYFFGNIPFVQKNFELVIVAILVISVIPMVYEWLKARQEAKQKQQKQIG